MKEIIELHRLRAQVAILRKENEYYREAFHAAFMRVLAQANKLKKLQEENKRLRKWVSS